MAAPLLDGGTGSEADFERLGARGRGAFVLIETPELTDVDGLFREYADAHAIDDRALAGGALGVVVMASRPRDVLYRHVPSAGVENTLVEIILEREAAQRAFRLLRAGRQLSLRAEVDAEVGGPYESQNVIGEIREVSTPRRSSFSAPTSTRGTWAPGPSTTAATRRC